MTTPILAKDIMAKKLVSLRPDMELRDAARLLVKHKISGAPVLDEDGKLVGVFTERDVLSALIDSVYDDLPSSEVHAYMTEAHTISEDTDLLSIAQIFLAKPYRRLPVVRDDKLVGLVSRRDIVRAVTKLIDPAPDHPTAMLYLSALSKLDESPFE